MADIIPGILEHDTKEVARKIAIVSPYTEWIQIDIGDNSLVSCETVCDATQLASVLGPYISSGTKFEAHLMVDKPIEYLKPLGDAGFARIIAHVESMDPREFLAEARTHEMEVGLAIDADTDFDVIEPYLEELDVVLVMTAEAGASGGMFQPETVEKIKTIHRNLPDLPIEVDGGITAETAKIVKEAGASRIVTTSYIFKNEHNIALAIEELGNE